MVKAVCPWWGRKTAWGNGESLVDMFSQLMLQNVCLLQGASVLSSCINELDFELIQLLIAAFTPGMFLRCWVNTPAPVVMGITTAGGKQRGDNKVF